MRRLLSLIIVIMCALVSVSAQVSGQAQAAQAGQERKQYLEDRSVSLRVDKVPTTGGAGPEANFFPHTSFNYPVEDFKPGVVRVGPRTTFLKEGLRTREVVRLLGKPASISERTEKNVVIVTYEFQRGEGRMLIAEFENGLLVRSRTESRVENVEADR